MVNNNGITKTVIMEQLLIVSYFIKYRDYLHSIRNGQVERAEKMVRSGEAACGRKRQNDSKRFIKTDHATSEGEVADRSVSYIDRSVIECEEQYDGFYAVCTNLEDEPETIVKVIRRRWEIEECLRIMKSEFITCFISLILYKYLEKKWTTDISLARS